MLLIINTHTTIPATSPTAHHRTLSSTFMRGTLAVASRVIALVNIAGTAIVPGMDVFTPCSPPSHRAISRTLDSGSCMCSATTSPQYCRPVTPGRMGRWRRPGAPRGSENCDSRSGQQRRDDRNPLSKPLKTRFGLHRAAIPVQLRFARYPRLRDSRHGNVKSERYKRGLNRGRPAPVQRNDVRHRVSRGPTVDCFAGKSQLSV